ADRRRPWHSGRDRAAAAAFRRGAGTLRSAALGTAPGARRWPDCLVALAARVRIDPGGSPWRALGPARLPAPSNPGGALEADAAPGHRRGLSLHAQSYVSGPVAAAGLKRSAGGQPLAAAHSAVAG